MLYYPHSKFIKNIENIDFFMLRNINRFKFNSHLKMIKVSFSTNYIENYIKKCNTFENCNTLDKIPTNFYEKFNILDINFRINIDTKLIKSIGRNVSKFISYGHTITFFGNSTKQCLLCRFLKLIKSRHSKIFYKVFRCHKILLSKIIDNIIYNNIDENLNNNGTNFFKFFKCSHKIFIKNHIQVLIKISIEMLKTNSNKFYSNGIYSHDSKDQISYINHNTSASNIKFGFPHAILIYKIFSPHKYKIISIIITSFPAYLTSLGLDLVLLGLYLVSYLLLIHVSKILFQGMNIDMNILAKTHRACHMFINTHIFNFYHNYENTQSMKVIRFLLYE